MSKTGRNPKKFWRVNQRAHKFVDRKKKTNKEACRKKDRDD